VEELFSQSWYRVVNLRPRLRSHAQIHRHVYRGHDWYILQDHSTGRFNRFTPEAYFFIGLMDGRRTMGEIWEAAGRQLGDAMPTQDEVIGLLSQLHQSDVLQGDIPPDMVEIRERQQRVRRGRFWGMLKSPMAMRFPLLDPDRFLRATLPLVRPLFGWAGLVLWMLAVGWALVQAGTHWGDLSSNLADRVLSLENLALLWLVYPVVKVIHEFAHAYTVKLWGGEVHEMGIMLLVLMPIPYVDATSASAFRLKRRRMLVGAAGMLAEVFLAALAMVVWVNVEPGAVRALSYNVMLVAGVSTLLFNGNPLLRFDAYYVLSDYLEIPNLGSRSNRYLGYLLQRYLLGIKDTNFPPASAGEKRWYFSYALSSFIYRIFISVRIVVFIAGKFFFVGVLLALWVVSNMLITPTVRGWKAFFQDNRMRKKRGRIFWTVAAGVGLVVLLVGVVPVPLFTMAEGVVWVPEQARVHAGADGFVAVVIAEPQQMVHAGDQLIECVNPELAVRVQVLEAQLVEYQARYRLGVAEDRTEADILQEEIRQVEKELARERERLAALVVRSPGNGRFLLPEAQNLPGRFVRRGAPLGYVVGPDQFRVRVLVPQADIDRVRSGTRRIEARLAHDIDRILPARVVRAVPAASTELPSLALSLEGGGRIALDPRQSQTPQAFEKLFQFEMVLSGLEFDMIGERVLIRFVHSPEPLVGRWYRVVRRLLLSSFDI
jgi:putative peptide zinc metalloprotease protein